MVADDRTTTLTLRLLYGRSIINLAAIDKSPTSACPVDADDDGGGGNDVSETDCFIGLVDVFCFLSVVGEPIFFFNFFLIFSIDLQSNSSRTFLFKFLYLVLLLTMCCTVHAITFLFVFDFFCCTVTRFIVVHYIECYAILFRVCGWLAGWLANCLSDKINFEMEDKMLLFCYFYCCCCFESTRLVDGEMIDYFSARESILCVCVCAVLLYEFICRAANSSTNKSSK